MSSTRNAFEAKRKHQQRVEELRRKLHRAEQSMYYRNVSFLPPFYNLFFRRFNRSSSFVRFQKEE